MLVAMGKVFRKKEMLCKSKDLFESEWDINSPKLYVDYVA